MLSGLSGCVTTSSHWPRPKPLSTSVVKPMFPTEAGIRSIAGKPVGKALRRERIATSLGKATAGRSNTSRRTRTVSSSASVAS